MALIKRIRKWLSLQTLRRFSLLGFTGFIAFITVRHVAAGDGGVVASPEAYCPFGGLETLFRYVSDGGAFVPHAHMSNIVLLIGVVGTAVLARSGFCGWVCPFGFIQELITGLSNYLQKHFAGLRKTVAAAKVRLSFMAKADRPLRLLKYAVFLWAAAGAAFFGVMVFRGYDPWATLINIAELSIGPGLIVLLAVLIMSLFVERPWCRYACPLGAFSGLLAKVSPVYVKRRDTLCKNCGACAKACPMGLPVDSVAVMNSTDCIGCLKCTDVCPKAGALELSIGMPAVGKWGSIK